MARKYSRRGKKYARRTPQTHGCIGREAVLTMVISAEMRQRALRSDSELRAEGAVSTTDGCRLTERIPNRRINICGMGNARDSEHRDREKNAEHEPALAKSRGHLAMRWRLWATEGNAGLYFRFHIIVFLWLVFLNAGRKCGGIRAFEALDIEDID